MTEIYKLISKRIMGSRHNPVYKPVEGLVAALSGGNGSEFQKAVVKTILETRERLINLNLNVNRTD